MQNEPSDVRGALELVATDFEPSPPPTDSIIRKGKRRRAVQYLLYGAGAVSVTAITFTSIAIVGGAGDDDSVPAENHVGLDVSTSDESEPTRGAGLSGVLEGQIREGIACFTIDGMPVVWPKGYSATLSDESELQLRNADGKVAAVPGNRLQLSGGAPSQDYEFSSQCVTGSMYFIAGTVTVLPE